MRIISEVDFRYYPTLGEPKSIYPDLKDGHFILSLQTDDSFINGIVTYEFASKCICVAFYDDKGDLIQPRIKVTEGNNLLFFQNYFLKWEPSLNKFKFGKF